MKIPQFFVRNFKIIAMTKVFITFYQVLSLLIITPYHILFPRLERKPFYVSYFKISSQAPDFLSHLITPCNSLSQYIKPYPLDWKENHLMLTTLKLVPRVQIFYHILSCLVTPYHTLSSWLERKLFYVGNFKNTFVIMCKLYHVRTCSKSAT